MSDRPLKEALERLTTIPPKMEVVTAYVYDIELITKAAQSGLDLRDFIGRAIAYYQTSNARMMLAERRDAQTLVLAEVLRFMEGDVWMSDQLAGLVPLTLDDLPHRLGGRGS